MEELDGKDSGRKGFPVPAVCANRCLRLWTLVERVHDGGGEGSMVALYNHQSRPMVGVSSPREETVLIEWSVLNVDVEVGLAGRQSSLADASSEHCMTM